MHTLEEIVMSYSITIVLVASVLLLGLTAVSLLLKHQKAKTKKMLFWSIVSVTVLPTLFFIVATVYINTISVSKGPVHWHADFVVYGCGKEYDLIDPRGLSNKIGTATLHEHNDKRVHLEGVVMERRDASLGKFFTVTGGSLSDTKLVFPSTEGVIELSDGMACGDGIARDLQVFVYRTDANGYYQQQKLLDPADYIISPYSSVPSGDCVIIELDQTKNKTERMCQSYQVALKIGKLKGER